MTLPSGAELTGRRVRGTWPPIGPFTGTIGAVMQVNGEPRTVHIAVDNPTEPGRAKYLTIAENGDPRLWRALELIDPLPQDVYLLRVEVIDPTGARHTTSHRVRPNPRKTGRFHFERTLVALARELAAIMPLDIDPAQE